MRIIPYAIKSAFLLGTLTTGAFFTGAAVGFLIKKNKMLTKLKKVNLKKIKALRLNNLIYLLIDIKYFLNKWRSIMIKFLSLISLSFFLSLSSYDVSANHKAEGIKKLKTTKIPLQTNLRKLSLTNYVQRR